MPEKADSQEFKAWCDVAAATEAAAVGGESGCGGGGGVQSISGKHFARVSCVTRELYE